MNKHNRKALMMKKALLRLKTGKGSVLFFIIAIMTVMIVLASAVYYSTISAQQQVEIKYGDEQSYQSAVSLNDIVAEYLNTKTEDSFVDAIINLAPNSTLTTKGDGTDTFAELADGLGDYKVTITKLSGDSGDETHTIKIETEVIVNGESSTVTSIGEFTLVSKPYTFDRFFTSTGYAPNDVFMSGMNVTSTMYLDNEYSQIGSDGKNGNDSGINIYAEIISAGTLSMQNAPVNGKGVKNTFDITVGNDLIMTYDGGQGSLSLYGGKVRVGGNVIQGASYNLDNNTDLYVLGDYITNRPSSSSCAIYVNGDLAIGVEQENAGAPYGDIYVNGDLYIDKWVSGDVFGGKLFVGGNVYINEAAGATRFEQQKASVAGCNVKTYNDASISFHVTNKADSSTYASLRASMDKARELAGGTQAHSDVWPTDGSCESVINVKAKINEKIGNPEYTNWDMTEKFIDDDGSYIVDPINYKFDNATEPEAQDERFAGTGSTKNQLIVSAEKFGQYVIIGDMRITNGDWNGYNIVFDTTMPDGKDIDMYVYLPANCYMKKIPAANDWSSPTYEFSAEEDALNGFKTKCFRWNNQPSKSFDGWFSVLTKGKGSVIFVVGDGVTYFAQQRLFMGHYNLLKEILPSAFKENGLISHDGKFSEVAAITAKINSIMQTDSTNEKLHTVFKSDIVKKYDSIGGLHNNLFIVAINKNSDVNFDMPYNTFCGFVYAPYMTFGAGKTKEQTLAMLGGLIVSDYEMPSTTRTFMATIPYDYYYRYVDNSLTGKEKEEARFDYMEKLISNSGGKIGTLGSSSSRSWRKYGYN